MSYTIQNLTNCSKKISFNFETVDFSEEIKKELVEKQKSANIKGFRPGKANLSVIESMYRPELEEKALQGLVSREYYSAIIKEKLNPVGNPLISKINHDKEKKEVSFDVTLEFLPEFELADASELNITRDEVTVTDEDLEQVKKYYLESKAQMVEIADENKTLEKGLFAVLNFSGTKENGEKDERLNGKEFVLEMGSNQFIPGFEEGMLGMKKGEKKSLDLTFPADYHSDEFKNAKITFDVELLEIKEKNFPEFTDELSKELNFESVEDFCTKTKQMLQTQKGREYEQKLHKEIADKLIEQNSFELPPGLKALQIEAMKEDIKANMTKRKASEEEIEAYYKKWNVEIEQTAESQLKSGIILDKLAQKFEIKVEDADLEEKYQSMATESGADIEEIKKYYGENEETKNKLYFAIRELKTYNKIIELNKNS